MRQPDTVALIVCSDSALEGMRKRLQFQGLGGISHGKPGLCRFVWNLPPDALDRHRCRATPSRIAARVDGAVKGGRSPAKRTLYCVRNANTLKGLGLVAASRGQLPSPSGGEDFPALGAGLGVGRPKGSAGGTRAPFHTKRTKPGKPTDYVGSVIGFVQHSI